MDTEPDHIVLNILREMRGDLGQLKSGQQQTNERLATIEHHLAGFHGSLVRFGDDVDDLKARVDRIERRLNLSDDPTPNA